MKTKYKDITTIETQEVYEQISAYADQLIQEATQAGALVDPEAENVYTHEIGRVSLLCADYESRHYESKTLRFKSPLLLSIEEELNKRHLKQRQAAELLNIKESTLSQIMTGKRPVSMQMAKKLYNVFQIDPKLIIEYA